MSYCDQIFEVLKATFKLTFVLSNPVPVVHIRGHIRNDISKLLMGPFCAGLPTNYKYNVSHYTSGRNQFHLEDKTFYKLNLDSKNQVKN